MAEIGKTQVIGLERLVAKFRARAAASRKDGNPVVSVGYTANYAIFVHENMEPKTLSGEAAATVVAQKKAAKAGVKTSKKEKAKQLEEAGAVPRPSGLGFYWGPSFYGPGFLVGPFREFAGAIRTIIFRSAKKGLTLAQAMLQGGLFVQKESMIRVPVEHGNLRATAFTRLE